MAIHIVGRNNFDGSLKAKSRRRREVLYAAADGRIDAPKRNDLLPAIPQQLRRVEELKPPKRRLRTADLVQHERIVSSIKIFGFVSPILIQADGTIIDGVARWEAAKALNLDNIPCVVIDHLSKAELRAVRIALNRIAELGGWEIEELKVEFEELSVLELPPLEVTGFTLPEIDSLLLSEPEESADLDEAPELQTEPVSKLGDVWRLGEHRIACGDARDAALYEKILQGETARLVFTDEPYNVPIQGHVSGGEHREFAMASGEMSEDAFLAFNIAWMEVALEHLVDGGLFTTFIDWRGLHTVQTAARELKLQLLNLIVWTKTNGGMGSLYRSQHELLPLFKKGDASHCNNVQLGKNSRWRSNVWTCAGASSLGSDAREGLKTHPTVKPAAMLEDALLDVTDPGDLVLDPFSGSGSMVVAAETTGRRCRAIELDPLYVDVAVRRWMALTGADAIHSATGMTFSVVAEARAGDASNEGGEADV